METLKYKIIKTKSQYKNYCQQLENLILSGEGHSDEIELLTVLIEKWDEEHNTLNDLDPIELLKSLMKENGLKAKDLIVILGVSKSLVSGILNYKRGLSKENIRTLSKYFKVSQEAFNRSYKLIAEVNKKYRHANLMNTRKDLGQITA